MEAFEIVWTILLWIGAALIGAWAQAHFGIFQDRQSRKEEKEESKNEMIQSLLTEIKFNGKLLKIGIEPKTKYQHKAFWNSLRINRIASAVSSEPYGLLSPEAQDKLSEYHEKAQRMNERVKKLEGEQEALTIQKICAEQNALLNNLIRISPKLKSLLESK